jgi:ABC-type methionine transport system ATPase subunit
MKHRTVVLVTNQLSLISRCDRVVMLESTGDAGGCIVEQGPFAELMTSGGKVSQLMLEYEGKQEEEAAVRASEAAEAGEENDNVSSMVDIGTTSNAPGRKRSSFDAPNRKVCTLYYHHLLCFVFTGPSLY